MEKEEYIPHPDVHRPEDIRDMVEEIRDLIQEQNQILDLLLKMIGVSIILISVGTYFLRNLTI